jgi:hypothetical protein
LPCSILGSADEPSSCAYEVTLARKDAKSRRPATSLRSKAAKAATQVDSLRTANAELKKKLAEALEQQIATSEVLQVISTSSGQLEPVFETILANAVRIISAMERSFVSLRRTIPRLRSSSIAGAYPYNVRHPPLAAW